MMQKTKLILLLLTVIIPSMAFSQQGQGRGAGRAAGQKGLITGQVIDKNSDSELQYVNVSVLSKKDSSLVNGVTTDEKGRFSISQRYGKYLLKFSFIGYNDVFKEIQVNSPTLDLSKIELSTNASVLEGVEITAERQMMEYRLDKRVVNVDKNIVSAGGDASDVLENIPSVAVDDHGSVTLRGNSNVTVLVDGKPSELYGSDIASVLAQIPASTIESMEIITNPSAKYDPEGMSGIINIKLKEKGNRGLNGNVNISMGSNLQQYMPKDNLSASISYSTKKYALSASLNARASEWGRWYENDKYMLDRLTGDTTAIMNIFRDGADRNYGTGAKLGAEWYINNKNTISLSYNLNYMNKPNNYGNVVNRNLMDTMDMRNLDQTVLGNDMKLFQNIALAYQKRFDKADQELNIDANWSMGNMDMYSSEESDYHNSLYPNFLRETHTLGSMNRADVNANYTHPFSKNLIMEVGYNFDYSSGISDYNYYINNNPLADTTSYDYNQNEQIHAIYATVGYSYKKLSSQLGLRAETVKMTGMKTEYDDDTFPFEKNYNSIYPTLHLSYNITDLQSAQISYTRRIRRPRPHSLMPTVDMSNPEIIWMGNPDLDPEYTDAFEIGYSIIFPKTTLYASAYYRQTSNLMQYYNFLWTEANAMKYGFEWALGVAGSELDKGKLAQVAMNLDRSHNYGLEIIVDQEITSWWKANISANIFGNQMDATSINGEFVSSFNWDAKLNTTISLPKKWTIQLSASYYAPRHTIQGHMEDFFFADLAIRKAVLDNKGSISIRFRDMFNTRGRQIYTYTDDYYQYSERKPYSQSIIASFSYRFGQATKSKGKRPKQKLDTGEGSEGGDDSME